MLAVPLLALAAVWALFDGERVKALAVETMKTRYQRSLVVAGPVRLALLPRLAVELRQLELSEHASATRFARVGEAALAVDVWPLLRGELAVDRVVLRDAELRYVRDTAGRRNVDDFLAGSRPGSPAASAPEGRGMRLGVRALELRNVRVTVDDAVAGVQGAAVVRQLTSGALRAGEAAPVEAAVELDLRRPALRAALSAKGRLTLGADVPGWRIDDLTLDTQAGFGLLQFETLALSAKTLAAAAGGWSAEQLALRVRGRRGADALEATLDWPRVRLDERGIEGTPLRAGASVGGAAPLKAQLEGQVAGPLKASRWKMAGALNGSRFTADGGLVLGAAVPQLTLAARFDKLDLDRLLPPPAQGASSPAGAGAKELDKPLDLGLLRTLDGRFSIAAGELVRQPYALRDARIEAALAGGVLRVGTLSAQLWGGRFDGSALADAAGPRLALQGTAQGIDLGAAVRGVAQKDLLEGRARMTLDVASSGRSVAQLKSRMAGRASVQVADGAIKGINLARVLREARALAAQRVDAVQQASRAERTDFSEASASFAIAEGVARTNDLDVKSPFLRLGGAGAVDVGRSRVDATLQLKLTDSAAGQGGPQLQALRGVAVPVAVRGPLDAIDWQVQWSAVAQGAVRQRLEDKLRERLGAPAPAASGAPRSDKDRVKDALRGILGR